MPARLVPLVRPMVAGPIEFGDHPLDQVDRHAVTEMDAELERRAERALSGDAASVDWTDVHAEALRRIEGK